MNAPVDIKANAPKRQRRATKAPLVLAASQPAFELTAEEMAWAVRFFSACRRMNYEARRNCLIVAGVAETMAINYPSRPSAKLRLVGGGTK